MKFRKIKIQNFMRYSGESTLEFSCDPKFNVTVIMGDNTFGKTTLAQAFRWGLYGEIIDTRYVKSKDAILLNKDVLSALPIGGHEFVSVELEVEEKEVLYRFKRQAKYVRESNKVNTRLVEEKLWMRRKLGQEQWGEWIDNSNPERKEEKGCVEENINIMFPKELSSYFFFDGERWSDERRTKKEIKDSIGTLMGITPLVKMKEHLWNGINKSVIRTLEGSLSGSSTKYEDLKNKISRREEDIERWKKEIEEAEKNAEDFHRKVEEKREWLNSNKKIGDYQKEYENYERSIERESRLMDEYYGDIVKYFSKDAYKYFAAPLLEQIVELLKGVDLEGKDIPDVSGATLDYLIEHKTCLCGCEIGEKEKAYMNQLRKLIYPNVIGSYVGQYQTKLEEWKNDTKDFVENIKEKADRYEGVKLQREEDIFEKDRIKKFIDGTLNFATERKKMEANETNERRALETIRKNELNIKTTEEEIKSFREELNKETANTEKNKKIQKMIEYAKALYEKTSERLNKQQEPLLEELNVIIGEKFATMFHEKEKYAEIGEDYQLHLYYHNMGGNAQEPVEELALSEGEIIARNFVFIVSILELAQKKKMEDAESGVLNLPLLLDGPFSKLGDVNTSMIAQVLPKVAEQVIVFTLDKDWEASGLEKYTLPQYRYTVSKDADANSATLKKG